MFPYQLSQALAEQHVRDMVVAAQRHALVSEARRYRQHGPESSSRLADAVARILAVIQAGAPARTRAATGGARASATRTSASTSGPMGCAA